VGEFTLAEAAPPDECELLPVEAAVRTLTRVDVDGPTADMIGHGRVLDRWVGDGPWAAFGPTGELLAVYEAVDARRAKPAVVLPN
jgi:hypothetical protein